MIRWFTDILKGLLTVFKGMRVTWRQLIAKPITMQYPDEKWNMPKAFRGMIKCDTDVCIVCFMCARACPVSCISIEGYKKEGDKTKTATKFVVDYQKCLYCGLCVEPCPVDCIFHSHDYETSQYERELSTIDWALPENHIRNPFVGENPHGSGKKKKKKKAGGAKKAAAGSGDSATAVAEAPAAADVKVTKVWIEEGCIVCDLCEDTCPEVFEVLEETCIVRPEADLSNADLIMEAAEGCPVDVIKYETA